MAPIIGPYQFLKMQSVCDEIVMLYGKSQVLKFGRPSACEGIFDPLRWLLQFALNCYIYPKFLFTIVKVFIYFCYSFGDAGWLDASTQTSDHCGSQVQYPLAANVERFAISSLPII